MSKPLIQNPTHPKGCFSQDLLSPLQTDGHWVTPPAVGAAKSPLSFLLLKAHLVKARNIPLEVIRHYCQKKIILIGATNTSHIIKNKESSIQETEDHPGQANKERQGEQKRENVGRKQSHGFVLAHGFPVMWLTRVKAAFHSCDDKMVIPSWTGPRLHSKALYTKVHKCDVTCLWLQSRKARRGIMTGQGKFLTLLPPFRLKAPAVWFCWF